MLLATVSTSAQRIHDRRRLAGVPLIGTIIGLGNSLTLGTGAQTTNAFGDVDYATNAWLTVMHAGLTSTSGIEFFNRGHAGLTSAQLLTFVTTEVAPVFNSGIRRQICIVQECTNTLANTTNTTTTLTDYKALCAAVKALGFYTIALTCLNFTSAGVSQANINTVNAEINNAANVGVSWDAAIDLTPNQTNLNSSYVDNFHLNAAGYALLAGYIRPTVQALL